MSGLIPFEKCPTCGGTDFEMLDEFREGKQDMSEGVFAEYMAGTWGTIECVRCGHIVNCQI
jgi:hypothetical protein